MFRRSLILAAFAALVAVPTAFPTAFPHIRVEGMEHTIFGPTDPRVSGATALDALKHASEAGEFFLHLTDTAYGPYVDQIGLHAAFGSTGWAYKVNGVSPLVGADQYRLKPGDHVLWYWALFGEAGGPRTLELKHSGNCYRVYEQDDQGKETVAEGAMLHAGAQAFKTHTGRACIARHHGLIKATLHGDVRSNALP